MNDYMDNRVGRLKKMIEESKRIVFFGGAGVSTESGIPDFRSADGLYSVEQAFGFPPEEILSHDFMLSNPEVFYRYYRQHLMMDSVNPNKAHLALAKLEKAGKLRAVITQNIDGLHQRAGSKNVLELHGTTLKYRCLDCGRRYGVEIIEETKGVPECESCGAVVRPDVVLYGEGLDNTVFEESVRKLDLADMLIVGGTSLTVFPAAGLVQAFHGDRFVIINREQTQFDSLADLVIHDSIGEILAAAVEI